MLEAYNGGVLFGNIPGATAREIMILGLDVETEGDVEKAHISARGKYLATAFLLSLYRIRYGELITDMVIKLLTHRTPPESITVNILTGCRLVFPKNNIVGSLPGVDFVHKCRSVLAVETKTLGGYGIVNVVKVLEHHSYDTSRRGVSFGNIILKISTKAGYKNVALSSAIFAADGTAERGVDAIHRTFMEGRDLLNNWHEVTCHMFPDRQELLNKVLDPMKLTLSRLAEHGCLMTDTCNKAQKFRRLLREVIESEVKENGMTEDEINVYKDDCWHHLCNVWIGGVVLKVGQHSSMFYV